MTDLSTKLQKRIARLKKMGGVGLWFDAPKQYRQLKDAGLVQLGEADGVEYAVLSSTVKENNDG